MEKNKSPKQIPENPPSDQNVQPNNGQSCKPNNLFDYNERSFGSNECDEYDDETQKYFEGDDEKQSSPSSNGSS